MLLIKVEKVILLGDDHEVQARIGGARVVEWLLFFSN